ncbi:MAG: hypothetical protein DRO67_07225, partial [Candidatus Asgardarchaeum californiense]
EQSIDGSPVMDFGTFQISGTPTNMTLYWEVPFGIMVDPYSGPLCQHKKTIFLNLFFCIVRHA